MADVDSEDVCTPREHPETGPSGPLLRDPPAPPGYVNPAEESQLLEEPFASEESD